MRWCPVNNNHYIPVSSFRKHVAACRFKNQPLPGVEEKLKAYSEYVAASSPENAVHPVTFQPSNLDAKKQSESISFLEELERQRDLKRRRTAYRKRGSHTGKKTKTEVNVCVVYSRVTNNPRSRNIYFPENEGCNRFNDGVPQR